MGALALCLRALLTFAGLYSVFLLIQIEFPYLRSGADLVTRYKHGLARNGDPWHSASGSPTGDPETARLHVMAFGHSKMLAGFLPAAFEADMRKLGYPAIEAYNFGLPGDSEFVADLEAMAARGTAPDVALLMFPWPPSSEKSSVFNFIPNDEKAMDALFPFRMLLRDAAIMFVEGGGFSGMPRMYRQNEAGLRQVIADRGYYFLARQSHYPNNRLPDNFHTSADTPGVVKARTVTRGAIYDQLIPILIRHRIRCILIPNYFRLGQCAAPPALNQAEAQTVAKMPNVWLLGPDYWLYPLRLFSDSNHLNPDGAPLYTEQLAELLAGWLKNHPLR